MTHISKHKLSDRHLEKLFNQLGETFSKLDKNNSTMFLNEFFGKEEKIMFAKRLASIAMCIENNSPYRIGQLLKMSPSTIERIKLKYEIGKYKEIEKILTGNKKDYEQFWETLDVILRAGMPPMGRGRWKSVFK